MAPSPVGRRAAVSALGLAERTFGRARMARLTRWMWLQVRLDVLNDPATNGEYALLRSVCQDVAARHPGTFLDVGANIGDWSDELIQAWADLGSGAPALQVHAFEPSPASFGRLQRRLDEAAARSRTSSVSTRLNERAVGRVAARADLSVVSPTGGTNTLVPFEDAQGDVVSVEVTTLDDYARVAGLAEIDFVKVDTEGNDLAVIEGAMSLLKAHRIRWLQFEYNHRWVSSRTFLRDAFPLAQQSGYQVGKITPRGVEPYARWHPELETFREGNYLLWHGALPVGVAVVPWWVE